MPTLSGTSISRSSSRRRPGASFAVDAFWDGGRVWRCRVRPDEIGEWRWRSVASDRQDAGLHGRSGVFRCEAYEGPNPVYRHGPVQVAADGHSLAHADGTPFFWLGDTVWNGLIRSTAADWEEYLFTRRAQGFSVVQFFSTHWRALATDPDGEVSYTEEGGFTVNPAFYQRLDPKVEAVARHGMLASAIVVLALYDDEPGWAWPAERLIRFARWLRARWGAYHVAWSLGGDGNFEGERAERWQTIGAAAYTDSPEALVTMHPFGWSWVGDEFRDQSWVDVLHLPERPLRRRAEGALAAGGAAHHRLVEVAAAAHHQHRAELRGPPVVWERCPHRPRRGAAGRVLEPAGNAAGRRQLRALQPVGLGQRV